MKIDLNVPVLGIDNKEIPKENLGKILASQLSNGVEGDPLKLFGWALKLHAGEVIDLDKSDQEVLKTFVTSHRNLPNLTKYRILECFKDEKSK